VHFQDLHVLAQPAEPGADDEDALLSHDDDFEQTRTRVIAPDQAGALTSQGRFPKIRDRAGAAASRMEQRGRRSSGGR
jgi:hypothetical protein